METLYRKVAVSERMPKKDGNYYTEQGFVTFEKGTFWQYEGRAFVKSNSNITHWLESIPDPTAQLKADKAELLELIEELQGMFSDNPDMMGEYAELYKNKTERIIQKMKQ